MVKDINPGGAGSLSARYASSFAIAGGLLFFAADDGTHGRELWESDGTAAGTQLVMDINPGAGDAFPASGQVITNVNGSLYFAADDGMHGVEPWVIPASQFITTTGHGSGGSFARPGPTSPPPATATVHSPITSSFAVHSEAQVFGGISLTEALPVQSPPVVRAQARSVGPLGPLGSSPRGFGPRVAPRQLLLDRTIDSSTFDRAVLVVNVHAG